MERTTDCESLCGELSGWSTLHLHSDEAQPHHWYHPFSKCLCGALGLLLHLRLDQVSGQLRTPEAALYSTGEHCYSDLCCGHLWDRLQR